MTKTIQATVRWSAPTVMQEGCFTVVVQPVGPGLERLVLWTRDAWLASLCERKFNTTPRPDLAVTYDPKTRRLDSVALPVAEAS